MTNPDDLAMSELIIENGTIHHRVGLTKREEFAKAAMIGILANSANWEFFLRAKLPVAEVREQTALTAIQFADTLLAELNKDKS